MTITATQDGHCLIATKSAKVNLNNEIRIGDRVLPGPGEYEVSDVFAEVLPDVAVFHAEEMTFVALQRGKRALTDEEMERLESVDMLFVHVNSEATDELDQIVKVTNQVEPRVLVLLGIQDIAKFERIEGQVAQVVDSVKLSRKELPEETRSVYILKV